MSDIPTTYRTRYHWQGEASEPLHGKLHLADMAPLLCGGPHDGSRYDPEHLLVAATEICLANTFFVIADKSKLEVQAYQSSAEGQLIFEDKQGYRFSEIKIWPVVTAAEAELDKAKRTLEKAHKACLVSRSLNCPVAVEPEFRAA